MRIVIQRVKRAKVVVHPESYVSGEIGAGLCVLVGVTHGDGAEQVAKMAKKICELKLLRSGDGDDSPHARRSIADVAANNAVQRTISQAVGVAQPAESDAQLAQVLLVSQFTLYADVRKGTKPSWSHAAPGAVAEPVFNDLVRAVQSYGVDVKTGVFGEMMDVELVNDGPFTIVYEC